MRTFLGTFLLRIGVAFALIYPAVMSFVDPEKWAAALPTVLTSVLAAKTILIILAGYQVLFAVLVIIKPDPGFVAGIIFLTFMAMALLQTGNFDAVYLNITVGLAALSLAFLGKIRG